MPLELNRPAWQKLVDEDLAWLETVPRTLERDHVRDCMKHLREIKPGREEQHLRDLLLAIAREHLRFVASYGTCGAMIHYTLLGMVAAVVGIPLMKRADAKAMEAADLLMKHFNERL